MSGLLLDTHIWLWHIGDDPRLPVSLSNEIDTTPDDVWLSPTSIWEIGLLLERGRLDLGFPLGDWFDRAIARLPVRSADLTWEVAIVVNELGMNTRDPADRFLAATAIVYDLTLLTTDRHMVAPGLRTRGV